MRTTRRLRLLAATGTAVAALALTACQDGTGTKDEGAAGSATTTSTAATPKASEGADSTSTGTGTGTNTATSTGTNGGKSTRTPADTTTATAKKPGGGQDDASADRVLCNGSNTAVRVQSLSRPLNHMLITVTNTGSKLCDLTYFPILRFDEMQWAPQGAKETQPQAVTTLAPGESGYAGVLLSAADGSGDGGTTGHKLTVAFQGMTPNSSGGASALPSLPAKGVYYDSSLQVTYWQQNRADALDW